MSNGKQVTLFALDCGATNWRLYRVGYRLTGNLIRIMGDPQPSPLTSFSERKLPAILTLNPQGSGIESFGEVSQGQLEDENARERVREYFKPCIGAHLEANPLPHQKRYTHAQALEFTRMLLEAVVDQIRSEKWRASAFDEDVRFAFAYPVHWGYDHSGVILDDFKTLVLGCFPESIHTQIEFVPEPEGAILSLRRQGLLSSARGGVTLIVDVGGSTTDIIAGQIDPRTGELLYLGRYGEPIGGGLYDAEMAKYLADKLNVPASALADDPSAMATLRIYAQRLKESLSRRLMQNENSGEEISAQRMITLVLRDGQVYRRLMKLDQATFNRVAGHLNQSFQDLIAKAIKAIGLTDQDIGQVALVGGGVQLFSIVRHLRERFGDEKVVLADNPDEIVVRGVGLAFGAAMGTLEPGVSLVIEPPRVIEPEEDSEPEHNVDPAQDAEPVLEAGLQLISPEGKTYPLEIGVTKVGRARECLVWLESDKVSRVHAELHRTDDTLELIDLGSTNGTFLNDERLQANQPQTLHVGDEIRFGDQIFTIKLE
ncbi:MAG: FHA domain-containing protein [Anaerolineales bacterium]|nr:FHA domain-containing protein [Chloroflexota bacterium]MBL6980599.1 FHA domain-containing protein [Anaerolineales bacterium]